jgi:hypothetical protein
MNITDKQKEFLRLYVINQDNYQTVQEKIGEPRSTLTTWYEELRAERERIAKIRSVWTRKRFTPVFEDFYNWYEPLEKKCRYCDITEAEIAHLLECGKLKTKRISTRGRKLEFDRKDPDPSYEDLDNIVLSCYWCNNAKTDTFTFEEFLEVGKVFKAIWQQRMGE